jgi:hypothetical protein
MGILNALVADIASYACEKDAYIAFSAVAKRTFSFVCLSHLLEIIELQM